MPVRKIRSIAAAWNDFWFADAPPHSLGLLRILAGAMLFYTVFVWGLKFQDFLGDDGFNSAALLKELQIPTAPTAFLSFWWIVPEQYVQTVHIASLTILALFTLGIFTRLTSLLSLLIAVSYSHRAMLANYGLDQINSILIFYLTLSRCGDAYSFDRLAYRYRQARRQLHLGVIPSISQPTAHWTNNLATRLLQFHYCVIYFAAGTSKLQGESWWNGEALYRALVNYEYQTLDLTWLARYPYVLNFLTHLTIFWEISFCFLVWNRHLRPLVLLLGTGMHLGIGAFFGMWTFGSAMIFGYLAFISPTTVRWALTPLVAIFASNQQVLRLHKGLAAKRGRITRKLAFDFFDRVLIEITANHSPTPRFNIPTEPLFEPPETLPVASPTPLPQPIPEPLNTDIITAAAPTPDIIDRAVVAPDLYVAEVSASDDHTSNSNTLRSLSAEIGPILILCSAGPSEQHARLIDYLTKHGYTCAVTRNIADARELTSFHQSKACLLWLDATLNSLLELTGRSTTNNGHASGHRHASLPMILRIQIPEQDLPSDSDLLPSNVRIISTASTFRTLRLAIEGLIETPVDRTPPPSDTVPVASSPAPFESLDPQDAFPPPRG